MPETDLDMIIIVPSRGRPGSLKTVAAAWYETRAFDDRAGLVFVVDKDDPEFQGYQVALAELAAVDSGPTVINVMAHSAWMPMVPKLNHAARHLAPQAPIIGFAGDDHIPRTDGWARAYIEVLAEHKTGIAFGNDLIQGPTLPTQWAMTSDIVQTLGAMVPADVEHLYCDNAIRDLGQEANCLHYLPEIVIEHMHPMVGRVAWDDGYRRVNAQSQYARDRGAYMMWRATRMRDDVAKVVALREGRHG